MLFEEPASGGSPDPQLRILRAIERMFRLRREIAHAIAKDQGGNRAAMSVTRLLEQLGEAGVGDIAQAMRVDLSVASRQVSDLVDAGLVERTVAEGDRRARNLRLTAEGHAYAARLRASLRRWTDEAFTGWTPAELAIAADVYERLVESAAAASGCADASVRLRAETPVAAVPG